MTTQNLSPILALPVLFLLLLIVSLHSACAQGTTPTTFDGTLGRRPYDKLIGVGAHLAGTTFLVERSTQASAFGFGFGITLMPLQPLGIDWIQLDLNYTPAKTVPGADPATQEILEDVLDDTTFNNIHNTFNAWLHFIPNPKAFVGFHMSFGYTHFFNSYGLDQYIIEHNLAPGDPDFAAGWEESTWGLGGGLGLSLNFDTDYGLFVPWAELTFSGVVGEQNLPRNDGSFGISQGRLGLLYYPHLSELIGLRLGG